MSAWPKQHRMSRDKAVRCAILAMLLLVFLEGLAAYDFYFEQKDVLTVGLIVTGWFKDGIWAFLEHFV